MTQSTAVTKSISQRGRAAIHKAHHESKGGILPNDGPDYNPETQQYSPVGALAADLGWDSSSAVSAMDHIANDGTYPESLVKGVVKSNIGADATDRFSNINDCFDQIDASAIDDSATMGEADVAEELERDLEGVTQGRGGSRSDL